MMYSEQQQLHSEECIAPVGLPCTTVLEPYLDVLYLSQKCCQLSVGFMRCDSCLAEAQRHGILALICGSLRKVRLVSPELCGPLRQYMRCIRATHALYISRTWGKTAFLSTQACL